ncbi:Uncharacterised protein [Vibrio cholerae]|nr:Uncharacterised protein [Vibrio cholerae]CSI91796.1 Uncharacterised protein [Vibrio cholerae]
MEYAATGRAENRSSSTGCSSLRPTPCALLWVNPAHYSSLRSSNPN